jgi:hypothetical protein
MGKGMVIEGSLPSVTVLESLENRKVSLCIKTIGTSGMLTFSIPKNLSLPSFRTGPESCNIFSSGVICTPWGSFFGGLVPVRPLEDA